MDRQLDPLRRERAELLARAERLRLWARLVRARTDLLVAQLCPPEGEEGVLDGLAALVLDGGTADGGRPYDPTAHLLALRDARVVLRRREEVLADLLCWSTACLVLEGTAGREVASRPDREDGADALVLTIPRPRVAGDPVAVPAPGSPARAPGPARGWHTPA